jgi:tetratricopeptide (TPR) repeat protein
LYQFFSNLYTLLDSGVLFRAVLKIALLSLFFHAMLKVIPGPRRRLIAVLAIPIVCAVVWISLTLDITQGYEAIGRYHSEIKENSRAYLMFQRAAAWGDLSPHTCSWVIRHLCSLAAWPDAEKMASDSLRRFPTNPELLATTGDMYLFRGNFQKAAEHGRKLTEDPDMFFWMKGYDILARALIRLDRIPEAVEVVQRQIERVPSPEVRTILEREIRLLKPLTASPSSGNKEP